MCCCQITHGVVRPKGGYASLAVDFRRKLRVTDFVGCHARKLSPAHRRVTARRATALPRLATVTTMADDVRTAEHTDDSGGCAHTVKRLILDGWVEECEACGRRFEVVEGR